MHLYISDLDGTLLNSDAVLGKETIETINNLIERGLNFTFATARSWDSARNIVKPLNLKLPVIVHGGVLIYDIINKNYILSNTLNFSHVRKLVEFGLENEMSPFVYTKDDTNNKVYYRGFFTKGEELYVKNRLDKGDRRFEEISDFSLCEGKQIITVVFIGNKEKLDELYTHLKTESGFHINYSLDIYTNDFWVEITAKDGNKKCAIQYLRNYLSAELITSFGDNLNDLPMFEVSDQSYAVSNALEVVKKFATGVIGSNNECAIARFLKDKLW